VERTRAPQQLVVTRTEVIRTRLDSTREVKGVERFEAGLVERLGALLDLRVHPDDLGRPGENLLGVGLAQRVGIAPGFVFQGV